MNDFASGTQKAKKIGRVLYFFFVLHITAGEDLSVTRRPKR